MKAVRLLCVCQVFVSLFVVRFFLGCWIVGEPVAVVGRLFGFCFRWVVGLLGCWVVGCYWCWCISDGAPGQVTVPLLFLSSLSNP